MAEIQRGRRGEKAQRENNNSGGDRSLPTSPDVGEERTREREKWFAKEKESLVVDQREVKKQLKGRKQWRKGKEREGR